MGIYPTPKMIAQLLKNCPLSSCELSSGWSKTGWLADVLYIHPRKYNKKNKTEDDGIIAKSTQRDMAKGMNSDVLQHQK